MQVARPSSTGEVESPMIDIITEGEAECSKGRQTSRGSSKNTKQSIEKKSSAEFMAGHLINLFLFLPSDQAVSASNVKSARRSESRAGSRGKKLYELELRESQRNINLHDRQLCQLHYKKSGSDCCLIFTPNPPSSSARIYHLLWRYVERREVDSGFYPRGGRLRGLRVDNHKACA